QNARIVIKQDMKRGDTAPIPQGQRTFTFRFSDNLSMNNVIIVIALLENDETPDRAARQGYITFRNELPKAVGTLDRLLRLSSSDAAVRDAAIAEVTNIVGAAVRSTIRDNLTASEKLQVLLGTLNLDDQLAVAHTRFDKLLSAGGATRNEPFSMLFVRR